MSNNHSIQHELVIVAATNAMKFPEFQFYYHPCRSTKDYSFLFVFEKESSIVNCLKELPRGAVVRFNLETKRILLLQGIFTQIEVTKEQLEEYKNQYEEINPRKDPILYEFQTLKKMELPLY